ncbi:MAG: restriction endonuclease [Verrucomicrobia bacterium]|nr:restriction endonuclease [Verrucomicrobiota bacterium]
MLGLGCARAADTRPVVGPGATRDEVISAYGWPSGQSRLGTKEVLTYPQGSILISDGKVERVDFSPNIQWAAPRPRPAPPSGTTVKRSEASTEFWGTNLADAMKEAQSRHARILAAFVGSDWSPPSRRFLDEVAASPDFFNTFTADFVFLKVDFPTRAAQPTERKKQNEELRARCGVTTYPALIVLSSRGEPVGVADLNKERPGSYREQITEAVAALRDLLKIKAPLEPRPNLPAAVLPPTPGKPSAPAGATGPGPTTPGAAAGDRAEDNAAAVAVSSASWTLMLGLGSGAVLALGLVWWVWRTRVQLSVRAGDGPKFSGPAVRLTDVPTPTELMAWPVAQMRTLVAAVFEATGYRTRLADHGDDATVELFRPGRAEPSVLVCCLSGATAVEAKRVREFFGTMVSTGIDSGWIVAPGGFSTEARRFAAERGIELIDGQGLISRLQALDPLVLDRLLHRVGA